MNRKFKDKILICVDCQEEFVFTVSAQEYFAERGFMEDPKRCKSCYLTIKKSRRQTDFEPEQPVGVPSHDYAEGNSASESDLD